MDADTVDVSSFYYLKSTPFVVSDIALAHHRSPYTDMDGGVVD